MPDLVIRDLVSKKKDLLDELLRQSVESIVNGLSPDSGKDMVKRDGLLKDLRRNDRSLRIREEQTGVSSLVQEKVLYKIIGQIILSIQENVAQTIEKVEFQKKEIEIESSTLGKERRVSGYIQQGRQGKTPRAVTSL